MSSSPSAPYFHFVQFKRFMAPRAAKSYQDFLQTRATGRVNNEARQQSTAHWGCNLRATSTAACRINLKIAS